MIDEHDTPRNSGFAAAYDTDVELLKREVGSPVIDVDGRIRGIAITSRGRNETQRGPTSVSARDLGETLSTQSRADSTGCIPNGGPNACISTTPKRLHACSSESSST
jgi:hypothetical protein